MKNLNEMFIQALQSSNNVSSNFYLTLLSGTVKNISDASTNDQVIDKYSQQLRSIILSNNFVLCPQKTADFAQLLGEAHFYLLCKNNGVDLERIEEGKNKTPDFNLKAHDIYFEVKTPSVVSGNYGIQTSLEDSLISKIDIEDQLRRGKNTAVGIYVVQPYGEKPYAKGKGEITAVIENIISKAAQNIKGEQFPNAKSFLVLNLSIIPPFRTENYVLRPAYCDNYMFNKAVSGELWMVAFANPGTPILGIPEFEGKPCVESILNKQGILVDHQFDMVSGILFMIYPWQRNAEIWGLYKYEKYTSWRDSEPTIIKTLLALTKSNWNDDKDTNGWKLKHNLHAMIGSN